MAWEYPSWLGIILRGLEAFDVPREFPARLGSIRRCSGGSGVARDYPAVETPAEEGGCIKGKNTIF